MKPVARSNSSFAEDYPEPLTRIQRNAFQRHLFSQIHHYRQINRTFTLIQKGLTSLEKIAGRLQSEKLYLTTCLEKGVESLKVKPTLQPTPSRRPTSAESCAVSGARAPARKRGFGRLAMIQNALRSAEEEEATNAEVTTTREKIARKIRLQQVEKDLEVYRPRSDLLQSKYEWCMSEITRRKDMLFPLMTLYDQMLLYEPAYSSAFFFRAVGDADTENSSDAASFREIPFKPVTITPAGEAILRAQIEEVLNGYVEYRSKMDFVLAQLDEEQQHKKAERINELINLIGVPESEGAQEPSTEEVGMTSAAERLLEISDSSEDEEVMDGGEDEADRRLVESALTALDDFQDLY